jgi:hypothetical protein
MSLVCFLHFNNFLPAVSMEKVVVAFLLIFERLKMMSFFNEMSFISKELSCGLTLGCMQMAAGGQEKGFLEA